MNGLLTINPSVEKTKIVSFIKMVLKRHHFKNVVIGMSGGIDSTTSFYLLKEALPPQNIFVAHLYYFDSHFKDIEPILKKAKIPKENIYNLSINPFVKSFLSLCHPELGSEPVLNLFQESRYSGNEIPKQVRNDNEKVRLGNIMARIRMIILYDLAKKHNALVCGTENKSEYHLGYFTRFGDQASDFEPIQHLYKTQVFEMAKFLGVSKQIINKNPTAGLWQTQTDEGEFGFSYKEGDQVLYLYYDKKLKLEQIRKKGFPNVEKIIAFCLKNSYKHHTPYIL